MIGLNRSRFCCAALGDSAKMGVEFQYFSLCRIVLQETVGALTGATWT